MTFHIRHILHIIASATLLLAFDTPAAWAQQPVGGDSIAVYYPDDSLFIAAPLIIPEEEIAAADTMISDKAIDRMQPKEKRKGRDWSTWKPSPKRALWLAAVLPGGGQIYNRKFWKLPIFYGGFVGCIYALSWNNQMYHDYSQAYIDIMDNDPSTQSYNSFLHLGTTITEANKKQYQEVFRKRKDRFRRYRDLSVFVLIGVYALSIVDAYVDASLSEFDISDNLSLHIQPAVFGNQAQCRPQQPAGVGLGIGLTF
ncbi:MAG: DUF5683 domain-containing protein [Prevotella sp.]|nr:DUF5683 domain-containing protein [Prevotella sp.]